MNMPNFGGAFGQPQQSMQNKPMGGQPQQQQQGGFGQLQQPMGGMPPQGGLGSLQPGMGQSNPMGQMQYQQFMQAQQQQQPTARDLNTGAPVYGYQPPQQQNPMQNPTMQAGQQEAIQRAMQNAMMQAGQQPNQTLALNNQLQAAGKPGMLGYSPDQMQQQLPPNPMQNPMMQAGQQAAMQAMQAQQNPMQQSMMQAGQKAMGGMPQAPTTMQMGQEAPRMAAMRNMNQMKFGNR